MMDEPVDGIAIVAMAGRFPGASTPEELWRMLEEGREGVTFFTAAELRAGGVPEAQVADADYVPARGVLADIEGFDAGFFGMTPAEAALTPPEQRLFLECAHEALERCGHPARGKRVGVFGGTGFNTYLLGNVYPAVTAAGADTFPMVLANAPDHLATRVAYRLDLRGPCLTVQTACSTSLVAVHYACQSLASGECDIALAGGATVTVPHVGGYPFSEGGILSPDGHCRPFDAKAAGTVPSSGAAVVALRRLEDALADGDTVLAVILGSAVNNDGAAKVGYTAPGADGQAAVIAEALAVAGVEPESVGYVEAHGTGTAMGDPIEVAALSRAYGAGTRRRGWIALGSAKGNLGHLDSAAGVTGLMKAVMSLRHRRIAPTAHFTAPNPSIDFASTPFHVASELRDWTSDAPRRAGVSSFGMGGTNAHVILQEAPASASTESKRTWHLLPLSAKTDDALRAARTSLAAHLRKDAGLPLADAAFTLQAGRQAFARRCAVVAADAESAVAALESTESEGVIFGAPWPAPRQVVFLFPGQGAQHPGMGRGLYETEPAYRAEIYRCAEMLRPHLGLDIRELLMPPIGGEDAAAERLRETSLAQPALFAVEYATARLWMEWGVRPAAMLGHSIGEYVAACLAGVFSLADALALVAARGRLMQSMPGGVMLSVSLPVEQVSEMLPGGVSVAADNAPRSCVVSGDEDAVAALEARLADAGVRHKRLHTSHAFHSPMMDPVLAEFTALVGRVARKAPELPWISNVTGTWITPDEAADPAYWARHLRGTVRFREGLATVSALPGAVLLETGPGQSLSAVVEAQDGDVPCVATMRQPRETAHDAQFVFRALGRLWADGVDVDWQGVWKHERRRRVLLPTYRFQRTRHWIDAPASAAAPAGTADTVASASPVIASTSADSTAGVEGSAEWLVAEQLRVMSRQLDLLRGRSVSPDIASSNAAFDGAESSRFDVGQAISGSASTEARSGDVSLPLTPVQRWFFEAEPVDPQHFNHALAFDLPEAVEADALRRAVVEVVALHDALRTGYACGDAGWHAFPLAPEAAFAVESADLSGLSGEAQEAEMERAAAAAQTSIDLERGPVVRALLFGRGAGKAQRLVLVVHHLAVDVFSWSVLLGDLETALGQIARGEPVALEPATTPSGEWAQRLASYARTDAARREAPRWLALEGEDVRPLPRDHAAGRNAEADDAFVDVELDAPDTLALLEDAPRRLGSQANDVLLAALRRTLTAWAGGAVMADLEGHGREDLFADADLSRTVGWFTAIHPFALRPDAGGAAERAVTRVRDRLRAIPSGGVGFGVLRHLGADAAVARRLRALPAAEVLFLYVGKHMAGGGGGLFGSPADAPLGPVRSPRALRSHLLEVTCGVSGGRLGVRFRYSAAVHDCATIAGLAGHFLAHVRELARPAVPHRVAVRTNLVGAGAGDSWFMMNEEAQ
jgi:non-ribosomal peptide synthase protein (TIGR01720 family)